MLSGIFFDIQSFTTEEPVGIQQRHLVVVTLNRDHSIYRGHFPGNPVVPGVCQVQMVRELVETAVKQPLKLTESDNIKFLAMINPAVNPQLEFTMIIKPVTDHQFAVTASIGSGSTVFLKFKGKFDSEPGCKKN
jgi:3-hydroxyacyl-[acyl-carrier-protein] dehydratase